MHHAGIQYGQGSLSSSHPQFNNVAELSVPSNTAPSTTASLRQWRKKDVPGGVPDKQTTAIQQNEQQQQQQGTATETQGPIARVAPHAHYPRPSDTYRYPHHQYATDYGLNYKDLSPPAPVKYSEIVEPTAPSAHRIENSHLTQVLQKQQVKEKEYLEMCSVQQAQVNAMKHTYPNMPPMLPQYVNKDPYVQKESQMHSYMPNPYHHYKLPNHQYQRQTYPNDPSLQLALFNERHPGEQFQYTGTYHQSQRMYRPQMHPTNYRTPQNYNYNYKPGPMQNPDPYRMHPYQQPLQNYKFPTPMEGMGVRNLSPRRVYHENLPNYPSRVSPTYNQCTQLEYAQHYQNRRQIPTDYLQQHVLQNHQMPDLVSDATPKSSLKQFLENWNDDIPDITESNKDQVRMKDPNSCDDNLYILDSTEIPTESIQQFIHLQVDKLPENIKGFLGPASNSSNSSSTVIRESEPPLNLAQDTVIRTQSTKPQISVISETRKFLENETKKPSLGEGTEKNTVIVYSDDKTKSQTPLASENNSVIRENVDFKKPEDDEGAKVDENVTVVKAKSPPKDMPIIDGEVTNERSIEDVIEDPSSLLELDQTVEGKEAEILTDKEFDEFLDQVEASVIPSKEESVKEEEVAKEVTPSTVEDEKVVEKASEEAGEEAGDEQNYDNAVVVEGNRVLLQIAGELLEVNVIETEERKMVSVVPYTDCTVVTENNNEEDTVDLEAREDENIVYVMENPVEDVVNEIEIEDTEDLLTESTKNEETSKDDISQLEKRRLIIRLKPEDEIKVSKHLKMKERKSKPLRRIQSYKDYLKNKERKSRREKGDAVTNEETKHTKSKRNFSILEPRRRVKVKRPKSKLKNPICEDDKPPKEREKNASPIKVKTKAELKETSKIPVDPVNHVHKKTSQCDGLNSPKKKLSFEEYLNRNKKSETDTVEAALAKMESEDLAGGGLFEDLDCKSPEPETTSTSDPDIQQEVKEDLNHEHMEQRSTPRQYGRKSKNDPPSSQESPDSLNIGENISEVQVNNNTAEFEVPNSQEHQDGESFIEVDKGAKDQCDSESADILQQDEQESMVTSNDTSNCLEPMEDFCKQDQQVNDGDTSNSLKLMEDVQKQDQQVESDDTSNHLEPMEDVSNSIEEKEHAESFTIDEGKIPEKTGTANSKPETSIQEMEQENTIKDDNVSKSEYLNSLGLYRENSPPHLERAETLDDADSNAQIEAPPVLRREVLDFCLVTEEEELDFDEEPSSSDWPKLDNSNRSTPDREYVNEPDTLKEEEQSSKCMEVVEATKSTDDTEQVNEIKSTEKKVEIEEAFTKEEQQVIVSPTEEKEVLLEESPVEEEQIEIQINGEGTEKPLETVESAEEKSDDKVEDEKTAIEESINELEDLNKKIDDIFTLTFGTLNCEDELLRRFNNGDTMSPWEVLRARNAIERKKYCGLKTKAVEVDLNAKKQWNTADLQRKESPKKEWDFTDSRVNEEKGANKIKDAKKRDDTERIPKKRWDIVDLDEIAPKKIDANDFNLDPPEELYRTRTKIKSIIDLNELLPKKVEEETKELEPTPPPSPEKLLPNFLPERIHTYDNTPPNRVPQDPRMLHSKYAAMYQEPSKSATEYPTRAHYSEPPPRLYPRYPQQNRVSRDPRMRVQHYDSNYNNMTRRSSDNYKPVKHLTVGRSQSLDSPDGVYHKHQSYEYPPKYKCKPGWQDGTDKRNGSKLEHAIRQLPRPPLNPNLKYVTKTEDTYSNTYEDHQKTNFTYDYQKGNATYEFYKTNPAPFREERYNNGNSRPQKCNGMYDTRQYQKPNGDTFHNTGRCNPKRTKNSFDEPFTEQQRFKGFRKNNYESGDSRTRRRYSFTDHPYCDGNKIEPKPPPSSQPESKLPVVPAEITEPNKPLPNVQDSDNKVDLESPLTPSVTKEESTEEPAVQNVPPINPPEESTGPSAKSELEFPTIEEAVTNPPCVKVEEIGEVEDSTQDGSASDTSEKGTKALRKMPALLSLEELKMQGHFSKKVIGPLVKSKRVTGDTVPELISLDVKAAEDVKVTEKATSEVDEVVVKKVRFSDEVLPLKRRSLDDITKKLLDVASEEQQSVYEAINAEDLKLHIKKVGSVEEVKKPRRGRKRRRFRNLYTADSDSADESRDYSVFESKNPAGLPKLIIKRNVCDTRDNMQPVVRLERDPVLDNLAKRKRKC